MNTTLDNPVINRIKQDIAENDVLLYMKGTPVFPQCGFSAAVVQVLSQLGVKFKGIDILSDPALRQGGRVGQVGGRSAQQLPDALPPLVGRCPRYPDSGQAGHTAPR